MLRQVIGVTDQTQPLFDEVIQQIVDSRYTYKLLRPEESLFDDDDCFDSIYIVLTGQIVCQKKGGVTRTYKKDQIVMPHMISKHKLDYTRRIKYNDRVLAGVDAAAAPWPVLHSSVIRVYMNELESIHENITSRIKREQIKLLNDIKCFATLSNVNTSALRSELQIRHCKKGESVFEVGDESTHFFLLFAGKVRTDSCFNVEHITKWPTNMSFTEWDFKTKKIFRSLGVLKAPSIFGHVSILVKSPRILRATCATDCTLLVGDK